MRKRWLIPAILLCALAVFLVTKNNPSHQETSLTQQNLTPSKSQNHPSPSRSQQNAKSNNILRTPRSTIEPSPNFPDRREHTSKELKDFHFPKLELSSVTLSEAVTALLQAYADICAHTNELPLALNITLPTDLDTQHDFHLLNRSFLSALFTISSAYATTFQLSDTELTFLKISDLPPVESSPKSTRQWTLPPDFNSKLAQLLRTNDAPDPFEPKETQKSPLILLAELGMVPPNTQPRLIPDLGALISEQTPEGHQRLETLLESFQQIPVQHRQESTLISSKHDLGISSGYYLPSQIDQQLDSINFDSDIKLEPAPSVLARGGETATIEIIREVIHPPVNGEYETSWVGLQILSQVDGYGFGYLPHINLESRPGPDTLLPAASILGEAQFTLSDVAPGAHALVQHQVTPDGQHQYVITRITQLDATGTPIPPRE